MSSIDSTAPNPVVTGDPSLPQVPSPSSGGWRRGLAGIPWRWTASLGSPASHAPVVISVCGVAVTVAFASHTMDPQEAAAALTRLRLTVTEHLRRSPSGSGAVISPALPPQVATASWPTDQGEVTLIHPKARQHGFRGRFRSLSSAVAVVPLCAHKIAAGASGLSVAAVGSAGVVAVAGVTALTLPSGTLLHPHPPRAASPAAVHQSGQVNAHPVTSAATPKAAPGATQPPTPDSAAPDPATDTPAGPAPSPSPSAVPSSPEPAPATPAVAGKTPGSGKTSKPAKSPKPAKTSKSPKPAKPAKPAKTPKPAKSPKPVKPGHAGESTTPPRADTSP